VVLGASSAPRRSTWAGYDLPSVGLSKATQTSANFLTGMPILDGHADDQFQPVIM
jgi:hypothetical protein